MSVLAIVQARTGSTRFPDKVFAPLCGKPLIAHVFDRISRSKSIDRCILATTLNEKDNILADWAAQHKIDCFRGSEENVLNRFYEAAVQFNAGTVVRITADDPFKDSEVIDATVALFIEKKVDFAYNNNPPSFPEGLDVEVFSFAALAKASAEANTVFEQEHVTQFFYRNPSLFTQANLSYKEDLSKLRWTIDTAKDYAMATAVYNHLYKEEKIFLMQDILKLLKTHPEIAEINNDVARSAMYNKNTQS